MASDPNLDTGSLPGRYFDDLYGQAVDGDPWRFRTSPYEAAKYAATLARLPRPRYQSGLEVGCSIGVFTRLLATRVDHLLAVDIASAALDAAREHCRDQPHVKFRQADLLRGVPPGPFDLIVVAEVAYYWTRPDAERTLIRLNEELVPKGHLILVHWRESVPDYPRNGDQVHAQALDLARSMDLRHRGQWIDTQYRIDLWESPGAASHEDS